VQGNGQTKSDSLKNVLSRATSDTQRIRVYLDLAMTYVFSKADTAIYYAKEGLDLAGRIQDPYAEVRCENTLVLALTQAGNFKDAADIGIKAIEKCEALRDTGTLAWLYVEMMACYMDQADYTTALEYGYKGKRLATLYPLNTDVKSLTIGIIGNVYEKSNRLDSALFYGQQAEKMNKDWSGVLLNLGNIYVKKGQTDLALAYYRKALPIAEKNLVYIDILDIYTAMAGIFEERGMPDSAIYYAGKSIMQVDTSTYFEGIMRSSQRLADLYGRRGIKDSVVKYQAIALKYKDRLFDREKIRAGQNLQFSQRFRQQELANKELEIASRNKMTALLAGLVLILGAAIFLWRNNRQKQLAKRKIEAAYDELKQAQQQLEGNNRELEIEGSLERVRTQAMAMREASDMLGICKIISQQLELLHVKDIRNVQTAIIHEEKGSYTNFEYYHLHDKLLITEVPYKGEHPVQAAFANQMLQGPGASFNSKLEGEELKNWIEYQKHTPQFVDSFLEKADSLNYYWESLGPVALGFSTYKPLSTIELGLFKRFLKVFELAYRRYLDIEKAEAQARESRIEVALEKVRSRTMAMQHSDELADVAQLLFQQVKDLGITAWTAGFNIWTPDNNAYIDWITGPTGDFLEPYTVDLTSHPTFRTIRDAKLRGEDFYVSYIEGQQGRETYEWLNKFATKGQFQNILDSGFKFPEHQYNHFVFGEQVSLMFITYDPCPEAWDIFKRFGKVFEQTYTRFLDLQKAEAQSRESQIELALERVRARTMAMQHSNELSETATLLFEELRTLGESPDRTFIGIVNEPEHVIDIWATKHHGVLMDMTVKATIDEPTVMNKLYRGWKEQKGSILIDLHGEELEQYFQFLKSLGAPVNREIFGDRRYEYIAFFSKGALGVVTTEPQSQASAQLYERFAAVFDLTYTRFLDLKNAEAQTREAQIELALERVRARTMAMHKTEELADTAQVLFQQISELGQMPDRVSICIPDETLGRVDFWVTDQAGTQIGTSFKTDIDEPLVIAKMIKAWKESNKSMVVDLQGAALAEWIRYIKEEVKLPVSGNHINIRRVHSAVFFSHGWIMNSSPEPTSPESLQILERFASVFNLTYRRFLDLEKAENNAKEATLEAALEKVRGKAMAMHNSNDLSATASMVFTELRKLGIDPIRCGVGLLREDTRRGQLYSATSSQNGDSLALIGWVQLENHPVLKKIYDSWIANEEYYPVLAGEELHSYYQHLLAGLSVSVPDTADKNEQYGTFLPVSVGCLYAWSHKPYNQPQIKILKRFAGIIDLTFRRYIELQQSETNAREAVKQAALDRVRAEVASMRTTSDLDRITPTVWNELTILGIPFTRCGVFIMDNVEQQVHTFLSTPDGEAIAAFHLPYNAPGRFTTMVSHWQNKERYVDHWDVKEFENLADVLVEQGSVPNKETYLNTIPHEGIYLHFLPFLHGMLYVGNTAMLNEENLGLVQSLADAFSTAYARYDDFTRLELAKEQVEKTLADLKQAQQQLVQSEKMPSLGELTAGIAHEIQNPLNFVNNFSDVSAELLTEMKTELKKGNNQDAIAIATSVMENLEKILHHGKRADAIVKGMLQHSRNSSGVRELTDINQLAEEYLRLAYHGLRAKDKTFNASFKTDFDEKIPKIEIIPQDMGRVLVNMINNAFYAVSEKRKQNIPGYEPSVTISTRKVKGHIELRIADNGIGISKKVIDKIFQPFFTTKPTGQGTGLGLSLTYDIIKAQGGEISVQSNEGEGSTFVIQLPAENI